MIISPHGQNLAFPIAELYVIHLSLLMKSNKQVAALYGSPITWCTIQFPQFCIFVTSEGALHLLLQVLMKSCDSAGPSIDPWGTPLVTGLQLNPSVFTITLQTRVFSGFSIHLTVSLFLLASLQEVYYKS